MARTGISYEQVEQAADALVAAGRLGPDGHPTLAAVREHLGTGSPNTIHGHLKAWKARRPAAAAATTELPSGLIRAIGDEIERTKAEARAEIEARLVAAQAEAGELARAGTVLEAEFSELQTAHEVLKAEYEQLVGSHAELQKEVDRLQQQLEDERRATASARVDLAKALHSSESNERVATELRNERDNLRRTIDTERSERIEAERQLANANGSLEQVRKHLQQMIDLHDEVETERDEVQKVLDAERVAHATAAKELAACRAEAKAAKDRADDLQAREKELRADLKQARDLQQPRKRGANDAD
jgi:colicin import membrane protein